MMFSTQPIMWARGEWQNTPEYINYLPANHVFVYDKNCYLSINARKWGAKLGKGMGPQGRTFAIPTKDEEIKTLPLKEIEKYVKLFLTHAANHYDRVFVATKIGCGLAGYQCEEIGPMFKGASPNVILPEEFEHYR